jgi:hypothetical protein
MNATSNATGPAAPSNVIRLVPQLKKRVESSVNADVLGCLKLLMQKAMRGELVGLAYAAMLPTSDDPSGASSYIVDTAGSAMERPTFVRGMLRSLDDKLADEIASRGGA